MPRPEDDPVLVEYREWLEAAGQPERVVNARVLVVHQFRRWQIGRIEIPDHVPAGRLPVVHGQGGTRNRAFRVPDGLYNAAKETAAARGRNLSDVVRQALQDYINTPPQPPTAA